MGLKRTECCIIDPQDDEGLNPERKKGRGRKRQILELVKNIDWALEASLNIPHEGEGR